MGQTDIEKNANAPDPEACARKMLESLRL